MMIITGVTLSENFHRDKMAPYEFEDEYIGAIGYLWNPLQEVVKGWCHFLIVAKVEKYTH